MNELSIIWKPYNIALRTVEKFFGFPVPEVSGFKIQVKIFSTQAVHQLTVEKLYSPKGCIQYLISTKGVSMIIEKDTSRNNYPWKLIHGSWPGLSNADLSDVIRQMGAEIGRTFN